MVVTSIGKDRLLNTIENWMDGVMRLSTDSIKLALQDSKRIVFDKKRKVRKRILYRQLKPACTK